MSDRDANVAKAKLAEQAERYDDMAEAMKLVSGRASLLTDGQEHYAVSPNIPTKEKSFALLFEQRLLSTPSAHARHAAKPDTRLPFPGCGALSVLKCAVCFAGVMNLFKEHSFIFSFHFQTSLSLTCCCPDTSPGCIQPVRTQHDAGVVSVFPTDSLDLHDRLRAKCFILRLFPFSNRFFTASSVVRVKLCTYCEHRVRNCCIQYLHRLPSVQPKIPCVRPSDDAQIDVEHETIMRKRCSASFHLTTASHLFCHVLLLHNDRCCLALPWGAGYHWWGRCRTQQRGTRMRTLPLLFLSLF